jgi:uncharacterized damage-inducible protein DinB
VTAPARDSEREALTFFLAAQRSSVLAIIDGLSDDLLCRTSVPSGWTLAGMIEHLGDAERAWFQIVVAGTSIEDAEDDDEPAGDGSENNGSRPTRGVADALAYYRAQIARSDEILAATPLDARPADRPVADIGISYEVMTVRDVVLHVIEETARHAGHLDVARELIDGRTGLGPR